MGSVTVQVVCVGEDEFYDDFKPLENNAFPVHPNQEFPFDDFA